MLVKEEIKNVLSQAYAEAALQEDYNMRIVADLYENLRPQLYEADPSDAWDFILLDNSKFDSADAVQAAVLLREVYFKAYITRQLTLLREAAKNNPSQVAGLWNVFYADAAIHYRDFICMLCLQRATWDDNTGLIKEYASLTKIIQENNWADAYAVYDRIACDTALSNKMRMQANVTLAQIIIYHYPQIKSAEKHLATAEELMPGNFIIKRAWSEYALKNGDSQKARNGFLQVITQSPSDFNSFNYTGDSYMVDGNLESAKSWYSEAIKRNFLQTESYKRLINLYADKKLFAESQAQIDGLLKKIEERRWYRNMTVLIEQGLATQDCFINQELYHAYRDVAAAWFTSDDMEKAEEWYARAIELQPFFTPAFVDLAYLQIHRKDFVKAKDYLLKAHALNKLNYEVQWALAYFYEQTGEKDEALQAYEECLKIRPQWNDWIYNFIGNLYYSYQEFEIAAGYFRKAIVINNDPAVYKQNLADALGFAADALSAKETEADDIKAEACYREAIEADEKSGRYYNRLGLFYFKRQEYDNAIRQYEQALRREPEEADYLDNICIAYEMLGQADKAEPYYLALLQKEPDNHKVMNMLGVMYYQRGDNEMALSYYKKAIEKSNTEEVYHENLALVYRSEGKHREAIDALQAALALNPGNDTNWNNLGVIYFNLDDNDKAIECYNKAIEISKEKPLYYENLGLACEKKAAFDAAIEAYQKGLNLHTSDGRFLNAIGLVYHRNGDFENAILYFQKATYTEGNNWLYYTNLGLAFSKSGNTDEALIAYQKALKLNETDYLNWNELGLLFREKKEYSKAIEAYRKAIEIEQSDTGVYYNLAVAEFMNGNEQEAIKVMTDGKLTDDLKDELHRFFSESKNQSESGQPSSLN